MVDLSMRLFELASQGFECSQIMGILALETDDNENPDLIRALSGLTKGLGGSQKTCGALTGGCCVLGYFTGRGEVEELEHSQSRDMIKNYVDWFEETYGSEYGGCECADIIHGDFSRTLTICAPLVEACFLKILDILDEYSVR